MNGIIYTPEMCEWLKANSKGVKYKDLALMFTERFGVKVTADGLSQKCKKLGCPNGLTGCFPKGHVPMNKGKSWDEYMTKEQQAKARKTCFVSDGSINNSKFNLKKIGAERIDVDGYTLVKVEEPKKATECSRGQKGWVFKQRLLYEKYHNVKLKPNDCIIFLDNNKQNFNVENLYKITRHENLVLNENNLRTEYPELTMAGIDLTKLLIQLKGEKKNG